jgi:tRNA dimethylallyltransferase
MNTSLKDNSSANSSSAQQHSAEKKLPPAICLMGPTASGKTALALDLCEFYPCEIISVDSALVYRGMDIGTAKPGPSELARVPHHLIDIRDPGEPYSAAEFRRDALHLMSAISARGRIPLLVGGSMLYFKVLRDGIAALPVANDELRAKIAAEAGQLGWPALHAELARVDPQAAALIHPNHSQRIQRALEVFRLTGQPISALQRTNQMDGLGHRLINLALAPVDRHVLHQRIAARFQQMLDDGLVEEVEKLYRRGDLYPELPSIRAVGYRQVWSYLTGEVDFAAMVEQGVVATRQLAKRQLTWLRGWPELYPLPTDGTQCVAEQAGVQLPGGIEKGAPVVELALKYLEQIPITATCLRYT